MTIEVKVLHKGVKGQPSLVIVKENQPDTVLHPGEAKSVFIHAGSGFAVAEVAKSAESDTPVDPQPPAAQAQESAGPQIAEGASEGLGENTPVGKAVEAPADDTAAAEAEKQKLDETADKAA